MPRTFAVDAVSPAQQALAEVTYPQAVADHVSGGQSDRLPEQVRQMARLVADAERRLADASLPEAERRDAAARLEFARLC